MPHIFRQFVSSFAVVVLLGTLFLGALCTESVASCGDWLAEPDQEMGEHSSSEALELANGATSPAANGQQHSPLQNSPLQRCHGPECRQAPAAPLQPLPTEVYFSASDACIASAIRSMNSSPRNASGWTLTNETAVLGFRNGLERPPQFDV